MDGLRAFEVHPQGMGWIGYSSVSKRIRREKIAKLVGDKRLRNTDQQSDGSAAAETQQSDDGYTKSPS